MVEVLDPQSLAGPFNISYGLLLVRDFSSRELGSIEAMRILEDKMRKQYKLARTTYEYEITDPTIECPIGIILQGNDDVSWSVCVPSPEIANELVDTILASAPISVAEIIEPCGMLFTN